MNNESPLSFYEFYKLTEDSLNNASEEFSRLLKECGDSSTTTIKLVSNPSYEIY